MRAPKYLDAKDLISRNSKPNGSCLEWTAYISDRGYGQCNWAKRSQKAHRVSYEAFKGPIPQGLEIDHLCRNRKCVNPDHLEAVTKTVNIQRGVSPPAMNARKVKCDKGHEFIKVKGVPKRNRMCMECHREWNRACYWKNRETRLANNRLKNKSAAYDGEKDKPCAS